MARIKNPGELPGNCKIDRCVEKQGNHPRRAKVVPNRVGGGETVLRRPYLRGMGAHRNEGRPPDYTEPEDEEKSGDKFIAVVNGMDANEEEKRGEGH